MIFYGEGWPAAGTPTAPWGQPQASGQAYWQQVSTPSPKLAPPTRPAPTRPAPSKVPSAPPAALPAPPAYDFAAASKRAAVTLTQIQADVARARSVANEPNVGPGSVKRANQAIVAANAAMAAAAQFNAAAQARDTRGALKALNEIQKQAVIVKTETDGAWSTLKARSDVLQQARAAAQKARDAANRAKTFALQAQGKQSKWQETRKARGLHGYFGDLGDAVDTAAQQAVDAANKAIAAANAATAAATLTAAQSATQQTIDAAATQAALAAQYAAQAQAAASATDAAFNANMALLPTGTPPGGSAPAGNASVPTTPTEAPSLPTTSKPPTEVPTDTPEDWRAGSDVSVALRPSSTSPAMANLLKSPYALLAAGAVAALVLFRR